MDHLRHAAPWGPWGLANHLAWSGLNLFFNLFRIYFNLAMGNGPLGFSGTRIFTVHKAK